jgi:hypothetical protein
MKTYEAIKHSSQVKKGDILVTFWADIITAKAGQIHHYFEVLKVDDESFELRCPSRATIWIYNKNIDQNNPEYFKRVY